MWVAEVQALGKSSAEFPGTLKGRWIESGAARTQTDTRIGCHIVAGGFPCHFTSLSLKVDFFIADFNSASLSASHLAI